MSVDEETGVATMYTPTENLIGTYRYQVDGETITMSVYGVYNGAGSYITVVEMFASETESMLISVYTELDLENKTITSNVWGGTLYIDENNNLYCAHEWVYDHMDPTCDTSGYDRRYCSNCHYSEYTYLEPLGHEYDENGVCTRCGTTDGGNLDEMYRSNMLNSMSNMWGDLSTRWDVSAYELRFKELYTRVLEAKTMEEIDWAYDEFKMLYTKIESGGGDATVRVQHVEMEQNFYTALIGENVIDFLQNNVVGKNLLVYYTNGEMVSIPITLDMIRNYMGIEVFVAKATYYFDLEYIEGGFCMMTGFAVDARVDMSNASYIGSYTLTVTATNPDDGTEMQMQVTFELYDNNYAILIISGEDETVQERYEWNNGRLMVESDGVMIVMSVNEMTREATMYVPTEPLIGTYYYEGPYMSYAIHLYGSYTVAGEYLAVVEMPLTQTETFPVTVYVTVDLENGMLTSNVWGGTLYIDENNNLYCKHEWEVYRNEPTCTDMGNESKHCIHCYINENTQLSPLGHDFVNGYCTRCGVSENGSVEDTADLEIYRKEMILRVEERWNEMNSLYGEEMSQYVDFYDRVRHSMLNTDSVAGIDEAYDQFKSFANDIDAKYGTTLDGSVTTNPDGNVTLPETTPDAGENEGGVIVDGTLTESNGTVTDSEFTFGTVTAA